VDDEFHLCVVTCRGCCRYFGLRTWPRCLTLLLLHPAVEYNTLSELAGKLELPLTTVQREVNRLSGSGLIRERRIGRSRLVSANPASRYTRPLTELLSIAFGPLFVIDEEFQALGALRLGAVRSFLMRPVRHHAD
jgi:DNA-binding transcriptional ArsR family regulator